MKEEGSDESKVVVNYYKPHDAIDLHLDPDLVENELGTTGIWKSELDERILIGGARTAHLGGPVTSDPWLSMIDDYGIIPDAEENENHWTEEMEASFQSVASSTKDKVVIRNNETGENITLTREEVIAKFREDRYNDEYGFKVLNVTD